MIKVSGNAVDVKPFLQNPKRNVLTLAIPNKNDVVSKNQEITPSYILDIKATGEKTIELPGIDASNEIGELEKVPYFSLDEESELARKIMLASGYERLSRNLGIKNPYANDESVSSYLNLEEKMKTGGVKAKNSYNKAFADIEASAWGKSSYREKTLSNGIHQYMDGLQKDTGVDVTNSYIAHGSDYAVEYRYGGNLCDISKDMLAFMQHHQDHQDIWQNVVKGTYNGFDDIVNALNKSGDTDAGSSLKTLVSGTTGTQMTFNRSNGGEMWALVTGYTRNPDDI
jgi:hypothetical protein